MKFKNEFLFNKSSGSIHQKEGGPKRSGSNNQFSSVILKELAMNTAISSFNKAVKPMTDLNPDGVRTRLILLIYHTFNTLILY